MRKPKMQSFNKSVIVAVLILAMICFGAFSGIPQTAQAATDPAVVIQGAAVSKTATYTLDELKTIAGKDTAAGKPGNDQYLYSTMNNQSTRRYYRGEGVRLSAVLKQPREPRKSLTRPRSR